jgi:hypothetical protein
MFVTSRWFMVMWERLPAAIKKSKLQGNRGWKPLPPQFKRSTTPHIGFRTIQNAIITVGVGRKYYQPYASRSMMVATPWPPPTQALAHP